MLNDSLVSMAFHEAGHTVAAFWQGFSCEKIAINPAGTGSAYINYGMHDELAATIIYNRPIEDMQSDQYPDIPTFVNQICFITLAGLVAEYILNHQISDCILKSELLKNGPDLLKVELIAKRFDVRVDELVEQLFITLISEECWGAIKSLVYHLIDKGKLELSRYEIHSILHYSGFLDYLNS